MEKMMKVIMLDEDLEPIKEYASKAVLFFCMNKSGRRALRFKKQKGWLPMSKSKPQKKMKINLSRTDPKEHKALEERIAFFIDEGMTLREIVLYSLRWVQRYPTIIPKKSLK